MKGILGDTLRLYWASLYWNVRKSLFRWRGMRGRCPCQHLSDSGLAGQTACIAITHWQKPQRFQRVCPLLQQRPDATWRCSVDASQVRPFWARAFGLYGGTLLGLVLIAALTVFIALRVVGYQVSPRHIIWPPAWSELPRIRAAYFEAQSAQAASEGRTKESLLALYNAYEIDPSNYANGLRMARLWQVNNPAMSDQIFSRLLREHPAHRSETARLWLRSLLARGDFVVVRQLAAESLPNDPESSAAWLHALIYASIRTNHFAQIETLAQDKTLPAGITTTLAMVAATIQLPPEREKAALIQNVLAGTPDAYASYYIGRRLLKLGHPGEALALSLRKEAPLTPRERLQVQLDALTDLQRDTDRRAVFAQILNAPLTDSTVAMLCTHLIHRPDAPLARQLHAAAAFRGDTLRYETWLSLYCLAGVVGDRELLDDIAGRLRSLAGGEFRTLDIVSDFFLRKTQGGKIEAVLPVLQPLPLDITYALLDHKFTDR